MVYARMQGEWIKRSIAHLLLTNEMLSAVKVRTTRLLWTFWDLYTNLIGAALWF